MGILGWKKEEDNEVKEENYKGDHDCSTRGLDRINTTQNTNNIPSTLVPDQVSSSRNSSSSSPNSSGHHSGTGTHTSILDADADANGTHHRYETWHSGNWCWLDDNNNNNNNNNTNDVMKKEEEIKGNE